jgi:hypothetical protein
MKTLDRVVAALILLLGITHVGLGLAPVFRGQLDIPGLWFLSGGLMLIYLALLNFVRAALPTAAARWAAFGANVLALVFMLGFVPLISLGRNPQVTLTILLIGVAALFSLVRRTPSAA